MLKPEVKEPLRPLLPLIALRSTHFIYSCFFNPQSFSCLKNTNPFSDSSLHVMAPWVCLCFSFLFSNMIFLSIFWEFHITHPDLAHFSLLPCLPRLVTFSQKKKEKENNNNKTNKKTTKNTHHQQLGVEPSLECVWYTQGYSAGQTDFPFQQVPIANSFLVSVGLCVHFPFWVLELCLVWTCSCLVCPAPVCEFKHDQPWLSGIHFLGVPHHLWPLHSSWLLFSLRLPFTSGSSPLLITRGGSSLPSSLSSLTFFSPHLDPFFLPQNFTHSKL